MFGGASRFDAVQIIPLRAIAALFLIPAFLYMTRQKIRDGKFLLGAMGLFVLLVVVQLVPLPPALWQGLPERGPIAEFDALIGHPDLWRPITLTPMRTWNVLASLIVPAAGLLLAVALRADTKRILQTVAAMGVASAVLGLLQVITGSSSPLYFYELTNRGSAVGIFANENHASIFAVCTLLVLARLIFEPRRAPQPTWLKVGYPAAYFLVFVVGLVSGSRAGFAASLGALLLSGCMAWLSRTAASPQSSHRQTRQDKSKGQRRGFIVLPVLVLVLTIAVFIGLGRVPAFQDLLAKDGMADLRWSILPVLREMISSFWLLGSGLGSFEQAFHIFEPSNLIFEQYINQAHNDWLQVIIEGGIIAGGLLLAVLIWLVKQLVRLAKDRMNWIAVLSWAGIFIVIGSASIVDYPLRTPIFQLVAVWFLFAISRDGYDSHELSR